MAETAAAQGATTRLSIERLLNPDSIAIAGISSTPGSLASIVLDNLRRFGFSGDLHLIHPSRDEIQGMACVRSVHDLPFGVDCVVLAIPAAGVLDAVKGCAERGVGGVVIFSAGFAELGPAGKAVQDEIGAIARASGMAVEGPNCLGYVNYADGIVITFSVTEPHPLSGPGIAVVSQSGAMATVVRAGLHSRGLDVSVSVSTGNEAANGTEDFLEHLLASPLTHVMAMVVEHFRDPRRFLALARQARERGIVLVLLHPGRSLAARRSAQTHTGALAGNYEVMRTLVERQGVIVVDTLEELIDLSDCALRCKVRPSGGVAILGESGAYKALALDYCESIGVDLPQPEGRAAAALNAIAPGLIVASNPLDLTAQGLVDPSLYGRALVSLMANPRCGSLLVTIILSNEKLAIRKMPPVIEAIRPYAGTHTVVFAMLGEDSPVPDAIIKEVRDAGIPFFRSPERALRALARFTAWADADRETKSAAAPRTAPPTVARLPAGVIPEHAAKDILERAGLRVPPRRLVTDVARALEAADALGFPVALKVQSPALSHKTNVGGVILGLQNADDVRAGWQRLRDNLAKVAPGIAIDGVLVETMAGKGLELILGARNDPDWGPVLAVGLGGVFTELLKDVRLIPTDLNRREIGTALRRLKGAALLDRFRGSPARDVEALIDAIVTLGEFVQAHPEVSEIDINPLMVYSEGEGALALDALISCQ
jgi:acyl-CoA synthetase (NDP forming)